jgi:hypothetical protein
MELWNIMDTPSDERNKFDHITRLISMSPDAVFGQGRLGSTVIREVNSFVCCYCIIVHIVGHTLFYLAGILCFNRLSMRWNA